MSRPFLTSSGEVVARNDRTGPRLIAIFVIALGLLSGVIADAEADDPHLGIIEYEISCLPCHGISGRGDGPRAKTLKTVPADLTQIAKHNKGEFPYKKVADMIDGSAVVSAHGQREMPVWGDRYRASAQTNEPAAWVDQRVREQIGALSKYLATLQDK
jgi:mono/diheme cytochrome c family protein